MNTAFGNPTNSHGRFENKSNPTNHNMSLMPGRPSEESKQRKELKKRIDDISLSMIDKVKKCEESLSKNLKENFSSFDEAKSIENELNEIEDT